MKKIIAVALVLFTVICIFTGCKNSSSSTENIKIIDFDTTRPTEKPTEIRKEKTYKVNVPSALLEGDAEGDIQKYGKQFGYDITQEKDGSLTMKMDGLTYSLMLSTIGMKVMTVLGEIVDSGDYPYVVKLKDYSQDFSYILMLVNNDKYEKSGKQPTYEELAFIIGQMGLYYQQFTAEKDNTCQVVIAGYKSGKILYKETYTA